jgi:hypothetical protein
MMKSLLPTVLLLGVATAHAQDFEDVSALLGAPSTPSFGNAVWADFDGDGRTDLYVGNHGEPPSLYRGNAAGTLDMVPLARRIGIKPPYRDRHGAAWADFDNDGDLDLFVTLGGGDGARLGVKTDQFFRNAGNGTFADVAAAFGAGNAKGRGRSPSFADVDGDGRLDLFVKNEGSPNMLLRNTGRSFANVTLKSGLRMAPGTIVAWADYDDDGDQDVAIAGSGEDGVDQLWRNNGMGIFTEVSAAAGLGTSTNGSALAWGDYDGDGDLDLFVTRGHGDQSNDYGWDGTRIRFADREGASDGIDFETTGDSVRFNLYLAPCGRAETVFIGSRRVHPPTSPFTLTSAAGKPAFSRGGSVGFFVWEDGTGWHLRWSSNGQPLKFLGEITSSGQFTRVTAVDVREDRGTPQAPSLFRNDGDGTFTDVAAEAGLGLADNARGGVWGDYDNDGDLDLFVVSAGSLMGGNGPNRLYRNDGTGAFTEVADAAIAQARAGRGDGASFGDYDGDGALDLVLTNGWGGSSLPSDETECAGPGPTVLLRNVSAPAAHWLTLRLRGVASNRDGVGARVVLRVNGRVQRRDVGSGGGGQVYSQGPGRLVHFGLGTAASAESVVIHWPSGRVQTLGAVASDQVVDIVEP